MSGPFTFEEEKAPEMEAEKRRVPLSSFRVDHASTVGLSWEKIEALRPPIIIEGFLRQGEVMLLGAESKSRKSWLAQDAGIAVASGTPWLSDGDEIEGFKTAKGCVHVFDLELADSEVKYRFAKSRGNRLKDNLEAQNTLSRTFHSYSLEGEPALAILAYLDELAGEVNRGDLVIVDCLYRLQADGNETEQVAIIFEKLKRFAKQTQAGVLLVDHFRKAGADKARDRIAGSFVKSASASTLVAIEVKADDVLELNIDARTFHGMNRVHARFDLESYCFHQVSEQHVKSEREARKQGEIEGWLGQLWRAKSLDFLVGNADGMEKWELSRPAATSRFGKLEQAGFIKIAEEGAGKATKWRLVDKGREILARNLGLHPDLHPKPEAK